MANDIAHKDLYQQLGNVKKGEEWLKVGEILELRLCRGSKHPATIRDPKLPNDNGRASLIATIQSHLNKGINQAIFKEILHFGIDEDAIWKALGMLK